MALRVERWAGPALVLAACLWAGAGLIGRGAPMSGTTLSFWRCLLGAVVYQLALGRRSVGDRWSDIRSSAVGGAAFGISVACFYVAYKTTTLVSATVIGSLQPLALGAIDHRAGHRVDRWLWAATSAAVAGTVLAVVASSSHSGTWSLRGDLFAVGGTAANVVYAIGTKVARRTMTAVRFQASAMFTATLVTLPVAWWSASGDVVPVPRGWWSIVAIVAVGGSGHLVFSAAQHHVSLGAAAAVLLIEIVAVAIGGLVVFGQSVGALQVVGIVIVAAAVGVWLVRDDGMGRVVTAPVE